MAAGDNPLGYFLRVYDMECNPGILIDIAPYYSETDLEFTAAGEMVKYINGGFLLAYVEKPLSEYYQVGLMKFNASLELEWKHMYPVPVWHCFPGTIIVHDNGEITYTSTMDDISFPFKQHFRVLKLSAVGEILDEIIGEEDFFDVFNEVIQTPDNGFITTQDSCWNIAGSQGAFYCFSGMRKYNADWEEEWRLRWWEYPQFLLSNMRAVTYASDSLGVVAIGDYAEPFSEDYTRMVKVSWDGEKIWERIMSYPETEYVDNITGAYPRHVITTSDGGYLISGNILYGVNFTDQWLMKVDEHGCLVPGCQNVSTADEVGNEQGFGLKIAPNPASEQMHVFTKVKDGLDDAGLVIHNMFGSVQYNSKIPFGEMTKTIDVSSWAPGIYVVSIYEEGTDRVIRKKVLISGAE